MCYTPDHAERLGRAQIVRVAVDFDDVVLDFFQGVIDSMALEFGVSLDKRDCASWDKNPVKEFPWKDYGYDSWWDWMQKRDWLWATFKAVPGAVGGISRLRSQGHSVELLTAKPEWAEPQVWRWLGRWRLPVDRVTLVGLKQRKVDRSDADVLVDDKPENCVEFCEAGRRAVLFGQPWNESFLFADYSGMGYADDWSGVIRQVSESPLWATVRQAKPQYVANLHHYVTGPPALSAD